MQATSNEPVILVVDDNEANRALAKETLEDEGYRVVLASSGEEGLAAFARETPDCVLLDVRMPGLNGFEVCTRVRALSGGVDTPILFLTALRDVDTFDEALRAGGDDFLTKPIRPTELVIRIQTALKMRRMGVELREHYDAVKSQRDSLMRLQLQKERLTAFVVHDLKNPVNAMDLNAQVVLREKDLPDKVRHSVLQIRAEARQLTRMILNLLDLSKADEGKLSPKTSTVALPDLVNDVFGELEVLAGGRKVALRSELSVATLDVDVDLLRRMLTNLVENALRHAPPSSEVVLSAREVGGECELRVRDSGAGVPEALRDRIFDPFVQIEGGERPVTRGGRGLGLTFCKLVAEAHGGKIWVEDAAPGSSFCVRFPR